MVEKTLSEVKCKDRKEALKQKMRTHKKLLPFVTQPSLSNLKGITMYGQMAFNTKPATTQRDTQGPATLKLIAYRKGKSLTDMV